MVSPVSASYRADRHIDAKVQHDCNFVHWRHSVASRMGVETEAKSSDAQAPITERLYEVNAVK